ncbi:MAG: dihydroneopterin aldolase [Acidimicrobiia bacterium]
MSDRIEIRGLRVVGIVGVLPEERERAQPFEIDFDVVADLAAAGRSDALDDTLDYGALVDKAATVVRDEGWLLLERVAHRIAEELLADPRVESTTVTVRKLRPPVPHDVATSAVTVIRKRTA